MKAVKDKIRFALWLKPETMEKVRAASAQDDCGSLSEFIEKAVLAYLGYLSAGGGNTAFLPGAFLSTMKGIVAESDHRHASMLFKLSVEMAMLMNIVAAFVRSASEIAEQFHIPQGNLRWYAAFHNEKHHPHVHLMIWSEDEKEGYLSERGIEKLRSSFAKSIFAQDWCNVYDNYTNARNTLRQESRERMREIIRAINAGTYENQTIENLLLQLARQLSTSTGKKQYGYLKPELKHLVDAIVEEFSKDSRIAELYDLWYDDPDRHPITRIDRKQRRQIDEKKQAQGMRLE